MPSKIRFQVIHISGQDEAYKGTDLNSHSPTTKGWHSQRFCTYPQDIVIQLEKRFRIKKMQILSHQYLIATKIEFFIGEGTDPTANLSRARFTRLGYVALSDNLKTGFRARELKSVHVDAVGCFIKFVIHKNHINKHNQYNQVGLIAINIIGDDPLSGSQADDSKISQLHRVDHFSPIDDLAFDMYLDPEVAEIIRKLERRKRDAVEKECYDLAKKIKATIEELQLVGEKMGKAEVEKRQAIDSEDYDRAKLRKQQIDEYRVLAYEKLRENDLFESTLMPGDELQCTDIEPEPSTQNPPAVDVVVVPETQTDAGLSPRLASPPPSLRYVSYDDRPLPVLRNKLQSRQQNQTPRRDGETGLDPAPFKEHFGEGMVRVEEYPVTPEIPESAMEADQLSEKDLRDASPLIEAFDISLVVKLYSKQWSYREESLIEIHKTMFELDHLAGKEEAIQLMRGSLVAINRAIKDNVFAVFTLALGLHSMILSHFAVKHRVPRSETANFLEKTVPNILMKTGETSLRLREAAKNLIIEESSFPEVKHTNTLIPECLVPFKLSAAPRLALSRTEIVDMLCAKHGFNDGVLPLHNVLVFLTHGALRHTAGEVRDKAEQLIITLYKRVGAPVKDHLLNSDEKTRKSLLYKQLFKEFQRMELARRGTQILDEDQAKASLSNRDVEAPPPHAKEVRTRADSGSKSNVGTVEPTKQVSHTQPASQAQRPPAKDSPNNTTKTLSNDASVPILKNEEKFENERVCIFCGEANDSFTDSGLDIHYWSSCPVLTRCVHCHQVIEICGLTEHLLEECDYHDEFSKCSRCSEAIHTKLYAKHTRENTCLVAEQGQSRCPLCHANISSSEESWRIHLMSVGGCPHNPRRQAPQRPHKSERLLQAGNSLRSSLPAVAVKSIPSTVKLRVN